jgi:hypothetical protein
MPESYGVGAATDGLLLLLAAALCWHLYRRFRWRQASRPWEQSSGWPVVARELLVPQEHVVWHWLRETFPGHHVMLKVPLARYTAPAPKAESRGWHKRLGGVYCSFTVCGADGTVIGCVDRVGDAEFDRTHCYLKESILQKCGIPYAMVEDGHLPEPEALRALFIGQVELTEVDSVAGEQLFGRAQGLELASGSEPGGLLLSGVQAFRGATWSGGAR